RVSELGDLACIIDDELVTVSGERARVALALLALRHRSGVSFGALEDAVWATGTRPPTARQSMANIISRLRRALGPASIETHPGSYRLAEHVVSERALFLAAPGRARDLVAAKRYEDAYQLCRTTLQTWRDEPWSGLDDLEPVHADRVVLHGARLQLEEAMARSAAGVDRVDESVFWWTTILDQRPSQEDWWWELARAVASRGDRAEGLRILHRARASLDQVGLTPGPDLVALEHELLGTDTRDPAPAGRIDVRDRRGRPTLVVSEELPFVGRAELSDELVAGVATPGRRGVFIGGPAGAGKSRLAVEVARRSHEHIVLSGRGEHRSGSVLGPFQQILGELANGFDLSTAARDRVPFLSELSSYVPSLAASRSRSERHAGDRSGERDLLALAATGAIVELTNHRPVLLLIDDMHWASGVSLEILRSVLVDPRSEHVTVLATFRSSASDLVHPNRDALAEVMSLPGVVPVDLAPLALPDLHDLVRLTASTFEPAELHRRTGGNAFFVAEVFKAPGASVGGSLERLVTARASLVHPLALDFLGAAALCGLDFRSDVVAAALELDDTTADGVVDALLDNGLLLTRPGERDVAQFAHGIVAESAQSALRGRARQRTQLRLASANRAAGLPVTTWIGHLVEAGSLVDPSTIAAAAADAAAAFIATAEPERAVEILERVLEHGVPRETKVPVMRWLGVAMGAAGLPTARSVLREAAHEAKELGLDDELVEIALAYSMGGAWRDNADTYGLDLIDEALARCPEAEQDLRARLVARRSTFAIFSSSLAERLAATAEAEALARHVGNNEALTEALNGRLIAIASPTMFEEIGRIEAELTRIEAAGLGRSEMMNRPGIATFWSADGERYRREVEDRSERSADATPNESQAYHQLHAALSVMDGDLTRARSHIESLGEHAGRSNDVATGNHAWLTVVADWLAGDVGAAVGLIERRYAELRGAPLRCTLLWVGAAARRDDIVSELRQRQTADRIARLPELFLGGFGLASLSMAAELLDDAELASIVAAELAPLAGQMLGVPWAPFPCADHFLGVCASRRGEHAEAISWFRAAEQIHERMGAPAFTALTRARWAIELGPADEVEARRLEAQARRFAQPLGLRGVVDLRRH
ncbi:MAG: AAA family ATPase, partial [Actinomycetota bacterium]